MKYAAIIMYTSGERTGATIEADSLGEAWRKLLSNITMDHVQTMEIVEILNPDREIT